MENEQIVVKFVGREISSKVLRGVFIQINGNEVKIAQKYDDYDFTTDIAPTKPLSPAEQEWIKVHAPMLFNTSLRSGEIIGKGELLTRAKRQDAMRVWRTDEALSKEWLDLIFPADVEKFLMRLLESVHSPIEDVVVRRFDREMCEFIFWWRTPIAFTCDAIRLYGSMEWRQVAENLIDLDSYCTRNCDEMAIWYELQNKGLCSPVKKED